MSDIHGVGGDGKRFTSEEIQGYQADYQKSFELFQKSFTEYQKPNMEPHKKAKFKEVMDEALQVMNETACVSLNEGKQAQEKDLSNDYTSYINDPSDGNLKKLQGDIDNLK